MNGGDDVFTGGEESSVLQPIEEGEDSSTFPPLPPPNFDDLSPNGTLKSATQPDGGTDGGASEEIGKTDTLKAQQEPNTSTGSPTEASNEATPTSATTQGLAAESRETQPASNGLAMPVRRKSSNKKKSAAEGGEGKNSENEDTGTFRRLNTLDTAARGGQGRPSPVEEERESASPQPSTEAHWGRAHFQSYFFQSKSLPN